MHVGMLGGYYPEGESEEETYQAVSDLTNADRVAALSCGMNPEEARKIRGLIGNDWLANIGGWLHTGESIYEKVYESNFEPATGTGIHATCFINYLSSRFGCL